jgi:hypothetical protein
MSNQILVLHGGDAAHAPVKRRFAPESGPVVLAPNCAFSNNGELWRWRGVSAFSLPGRYFRGEDPMPFFKWCERIGINVLRIWPDASNWVPTDFRTNPARDAQLAELLDIGASEGLRFEITCIANWTTPDQDRPIVRRIYDLAAGRWNVFVEAVNEPWNIGYDCIALMNGVDRHGLLSAYGYNVDGGENGWETIGMLDYLTPHTPRDMAHYPRNSKDVYEMRALGHTLVDDEPLGVADYDKEGSGARSTDVDAHASHFGVGALFSAGETIHPQCGMEGRPPSANEPKTDHICDVIGQVWAFIPPEAVSGVYSRNGLHEFPFIVDGSDTYDGQGHAYAMIVGNTAWTVIPKPTDRWLYGDKENNIPPGIERTTGGWRVGEVGPVPYVVKMVR